MYFRQRKYEITVTLTETIHPSPTPAGDAPPSATDSGHPRLRSSRAPKATKKIRRALAATVLALGLSATAVVIPTGTASADYTYYVYESRSTVKQKAGILTWASIGCVFALRSQWYLSFACSTGTAGKAYDLAAKYDCKLATRVTINTSSQYSWDKASYRYYPYACLK